MKKPKKYDIYSMKHGAVIKNTWSEEGYNHACDDWEKYHQSVLKGLLIKIKTLYVDYVGCRWVVKDIIKIIKEKKNDDISNI